MRNVKQIARQVHHIRAVAVLEKGPAFRWLATKPEILDELGRIESDCALLDIAKRISELKPSTAAAIEMIRRHREFDQLADEITHVIKDYCKRHPATTRHDVLRALETAGMMSGKTPERGEVGRHQFLRKLAGAPAKTE